MRGLASPGTGLALAFAGVGLCLSCGSPDSTPAAAEATAAVDDELFVPEFPGIRDHWMRKVTFGPWYGSGCPDNGACGCGGANDLAREFSCQMDRLASYDIPVTVYLFDGSAWSRRNSAENNSCSGPDCCSWKLGDAVAQRLNRDQVRGLLHFWGGCHEPAQYQRAFGQLGSSLLGFYLDDGSSDADLQEAAEFMKSALPNNWEVVPKAYQNRAPATTNSGLSRWGNVSYVGDLPVGYAGLKEGITRVLAKARYLPAPYNELTGYAYGEEGVRPEEDVFQRRLHFGAFQPVMAHTPYANADPWRPEYSPDLVNTYRYYAWLHKELVPYFYSYAYAMHENPAQPVMRRGPMTYSMRVGNEIYVPFVTEPVDTMTVTLPGGSWIDYWNESHVVSGTLRDWPVGPGREPVFIRQGAIVPMDVRRAHTGHGTPESLGSLTLLVYPSGTSTFRYRDSSSATWITFTSRLSGNQLTITPDPALPDSPVIYRIGRWTRPTTAVGFDGAVLTVNQSGSVRQLGNERAVNGSSDSAWCYDETAQRLIVKVVPPKG